MAIKLAMFAMICTSALLAACGGGGGGSGSSSQVSLSLAPMHVQASAATTDTAPTATFTASVTSVPSTGLYIDYRYSTNGISGVSLGSGSGTTQDVVLQFADPSALAPGVYSDTVEISVCPDSKCATQVGNSPQTVTATYTVTQGDPATATPSITGAIPASTAAGSPAFDLTLTGRNFAPNSVVLWNGSALVTNYVSLIQLTAQVPAGDVASPQTAMISVSNAGSGGGVSSPLSFQVTPPTPVVTSISPTTVYAGTAAFTLTVNGANFSYGSIIVLNGAYLTTNFVSATQLTAQVPATAIAAIGSLLVTVANQYGSGPISTTHASLAVVDAPFAATTISPLTVSAGGPAYVETVLGSGFTANSTVRWNGSPRATTFVSTSELLAQITMADIASAGTASVTVVDSGISGGSTTPISVAIVPPPIDAVAFQINPQHSGAVQFANVVAANALPTVPTWSVDLGGAPSYALIAAGKVFLTASLGGGASELIALDQTTGATVWGPILLSGGANAAFDSGRIFVRTSTGSVNGGLVQAFDAQTGVPLWSTATTTQAFASGPPTAADGMVYVTGEGGGITVYALDQANGALVWSSLLMAGNGATPAVTADGVYSSYPCITADFRPLTGETVWTNNTGCDGGGGAIGVAANGIYYSPNGFGVYSGMTFNAETGLSTGSYVATNPPAIGSQAGYFLQGGTLRAIANASNTILWSFAGDGTLSTSPILVNGYVFVGGSSGNLYMLDATTGAQLQVVNLGSPIGGGGGWMSSFPISGMSAGDGLLMVPAGNSIYAFTLSTNP